MFNQPGFHRGHAAVEPNQEEQKRMQKVRVLAAAAALAALGATGGQALAASQVITLNATVASYCTSSGTGSETISLTSLVTSGFIAATPTNSTALNILCNNKTNVSLSSANGGLFDPAVTSAATGFQNRINYNATVTIGGASATVAATGATKAAIVGSTVATATAFSDTGDKVVITPVVNASPIMSGTGYTDTLTLSVIAQ